MKRDMGVILAMLTWVEQNLTPNHMVDSHAFKIEGISADLLQSNADLCVNTGLVVSARNHARSWTGLTWAGYDLLEELRRDESVPKLTILDG